MTRRITPTYVLLNQITLTTTPSTVTFSNIPQNYGDLRLVVAGTLNSFDGVGVRFNADSGNNYSSVVMFGSGSSFGSINYTGAEAAAGILSSTQGVSTADIMDYSSIDKHKTVVSRGDVADTQTRANASRWANTAAVTSMTVVAGGGAKTFGAGTILSLYGVHA
jgi:hypothetical protein